MAESIEVLSPAGKAKQNPQGMAERLATLDGKVVGILDNGKPNADLLLREVADKLKSRYGISEVIAFRKRTVNEAASQDILQSLSSRADAVVVATGD